MRERLFIIGNGFDSAHDLPTKYSDFYTFLANADVSSAEYFLLELLEDEFYTCTYRKLPVYC